MQQEPSPAESWVRPKERAEPNVACAILRARAARSPSSGEEDPLRAQQDQETELFLNGVYLQHHEQTHGRRARRFEGRTSNMVVVVV